MPFRKQHESFKANDDERRLMLNTIAPTWDGNQTWLVFAGGVLFAVWPAVYGMIFSGLYPAILLILFSFFLRPPGFDYRSKLPNDGWRQFWDWSLFVSGFIPVILFGLVLGNLFVGYKFYHDDMFMRSIYYGNLFDLINPFAVLTALMAVFMVLMHGALHLNRRLDETIAQDFRRLFHLFAKFFLITVTLAIFMLLWWLEGYILKEPGAHISTFNTPVKVELGGWMHNYMEHPWMWTAPILVYVGVFVAMITARWYKGLAFWSSCIAISSLLFSVAFALFPFVVPSQYAGAGTALGSESLTIWNVTSQPYTLMGMLYICIPVLVAAVIVKVMGMFALWRQKNYLSDADLKQNEHTFY
jgi:cytochrome d ubiquinol oxidase subunit II